MTKNIMKTNLLLPMHIGNTIINFQGKSGFNFWSQFFPQLWYIYVFSNMGLLTVALELGKFKLSQQAQEYSSNKTFFLALLT